ncbi:MULTISPECIES: PA2779 family protein [unclassified Sulfurospirillum]|uniref:PA2779 family protein n=1 Tax=unclassified Sulfurospirillum TaxID=2618290 RepID=UPI00068A52F2|nr:MULTISPECIES: PA2779 family protein [unclassified Sulfurospirillum]
MNIAKFVIAFIVSLSLFSSTMFAGVISTKDVLHESHSSVTIDNFLAKQEVQSKLLEFGVSAENVQARIATLTDEEIAQINEQIESMPAGGSAGGAILGVLVFIFIVLLITDILGFTKVFNFTRSVQ